MTETLMQRLLAAVFDDETIGDDLVADLAASAEAHGELVRLAAVLAGLPGHGARAAERRLDSLLDDVALAAASESRAPSAGASAMRELADHQLLARPVDRHTPWVPRMPFGRHLEAEATAIGTPAGQPPSRAPEPVGEASLDLPNRWAFGVAAHREPFSTERVPKLERLALAGVAVVAAAVVIAIAWWGHGAGTTASCVDSDLQPAMAQPARAVAPPAARSALVDVVVHVSPETAQISIDGKPLGGPSLSRRYAGDEAVHHVRASAPGYITKSVTVMFNVNLMVDLSLERSEPRGGARAARERTALVGHTVPVELSTSHADADAIPDRSAKHIDTSNPYDEDLDHQLAR
jgi:hypothetical protein